MILGLQILIVAVILGGAYWLALQLPSCFLLGIIAGALLYGLADWIDPGCLRR